MGSRVEDIVARLIARQHGVLTRTQAYREGVTRRQLDYRLELGDWRPLYPGVYRVTGSTPSWQQQLTATSLWAAREYAFSHRCAAALWGFARFTRQVVELTTTRNLRSTPPATVHVVGELPDEEIAFVDGFRVTVVARTLIDLAENEAFKDVRASVDQALRHKWTTLDQLEVMVQRKRPGILPLRRLIDEYRNGGKPAESELEARALELFEAGGLPKPVKQKEFKMGGRVCRVDFHVPGTRLIVEADGYAFHGGEAFDTDRIRDIVLESNGYIVQRWTWNAIAQDQQLLIAAARRVIALGPRPEDLAKPRP